MTLTLRPNKQPSSLRTRRRRKLTAFDIVNLAVLFAIVAACIYPFVYILAVSLSDGSAVNAGKVVLVPEAINIETYKYVLTNERLGILRSLLNSLLYTSVGVAFSVAITYLTAYPLSKTRLGGAGAIVMLFLITWVFDAGIVPTYVINSQLGFVNNWLAMVIPFGFSTFLLLISITFLKNIPIELEESAVIDGANDWQTMWRIYLPLSRPLLGTIGIFYAVQIWNSFLVPLIYLQDKTLAPIQLVLYRLLLNTDTNATSFQQITMGGHQLVPQNIAAVTMVFAIVPILAFYPYAQRYFQQGILVGAIKG
ncbi:carbohydrate ABC transporter permease [Paenarthrobacter sp. NPDC057981]|uniref:carbohydrate ABC transporter permease n=1 Tax=Paenarthrobacter sp. NPDC057981 TaxID=3346297 RepID=UPI0036D837BD